jgi:hypothetical protein
MRNRDLELIAALVEGRLDDETQARALIESSAEARAEYEAQRLAYNVLSDLEPAALTETERSALHRDVWGALRSHPVGKTTSAPWYVRWVPAVAGISVLVIVGVVVTLGGGQESGDFSEVAADLGGATTTAAASGGAEDGDAGGDMAPLDAPTSTAGAMSQEEDEISPEATQFFTAEAARIRTTEGPGTTVGDDSTEQTDLESCLEDADLGGHVVADTVDVPDELDAAPGTVIAAIPEGVEVEGAPVTFVDRSTCEVVYVDE